MFHKARASAVGDCVLATRPNFKKRDPALDNVCRIDGTVQGSLDYPKHKLTIGESGRVKANVHARIIIVEGTVEGDLHGAEAVYLRRTAHVTGDIKSPRIAIEDGAAFEGSLKTS